MNQLVIHGQLVDQMGLVQQRSTIVHPGAYPQRVETRIRSLQFLPESFRPQQNAVRLNIGHERSAVAGRLTALERDARGLWATCVSDELELLRDLATPWYFSAEARWRGTDVHPEDVELEAIALVRTPAANSIQPVEILVGSLNSRFDRQRWRLHDATHDRLERAGEQLRHRSADDPVSVWDHTPETERLLRRRDWKPAELAMAIERANEQRRPSAPLRHSAPYRGVLRVS